MTDEELKTIFENICNAFEKTNNINKELLNKILYLDARLTELEQKEK